MRPRSRLVRALASLGLLGLTAAAPAPARVKTPEAAAAFATGDYATAYRLADQAIAACAPTPAQPDRCLDLLLTGPSYALAAGEAAVAEQWARRGLEVARANTKGDPGEAVIAMVTLAGAIGGQGRIADAEALDRDALAQSRKILGEAHPLTATIENSLAGLLDAQGKLAEAEPLRRSAIAGFRASLGERNAALPTLLNGLGDNLAGQARYRDAEVIYADALAKAREINGPAHPAVAFNLNSLGVLKQKLGKFADAERLFQDAAAIDRAALGEQHPLVGRDVSNLGVLYLDEGRLGEAEAQFRRAVVIAEVASGRDSPAVASDIGNLAVTLRQLGRTTEAEALTRRALAIESAAFGADSPRVGAVYASLAANLEAQQRAPEAQALRDRVLAIDRKAFGADHPDTAASLANLAGNLAAQGRYDAAEPLLRQALRAQERALGAENVAVANTLSQLGVVVARASRPAEAEPLFRRALAIRRAALGQRSPDTAGGQHNLAAVLELLGRPAEAEGPARAALEIRRAILPPNHPDIAASETLLARILAAQPTRRAEALDHARAAMAIVRGRRLQAAGGEAGGSLAGRAELRARAGRGVSDPLDRAFSAFLEAAAVSPGRAALNDEAFIAAQDLDVSAAGLAMAQTAARTAAGGGALADLARRQQDLSARIRVLDARAVEALGAGLADKATALRAELDATATDLGKVDAQLRAGFPAYSTLVSPRPLSIDEVRQRLTPGEGLLLIAPSGDDLYVFAIGPGRSAWRRIPNGALTVREPVSRLRCAVDPATCTTRGLPPAFDPATAHALYRTLVRPVEPALRGARRLFVTAGGPLADLPLDLLVTNSPSVGKGPERLARVAWLGDRYAMTSLPSISVLRGRQAARAAESGLAFVGYGDPVFAPPPGAAPGSDRAGSDLKLLRGLPALPGTRIELNAMAQALGAAPGSVVLGQRANEAAVRADPRVARAEVVAFATHGLLPGELNGHNEPALVLSPPPIAGPDDDGLLSASDVSQLSLAADWVVLSACNTASAEGGSDSLSALARAFLYAGARALLASHWRVADDSTAALTVEMLATARAHPELSRAEARQHAMRAVRTGRRADGSAVEGWTPEWRDPGAWAPFTLIAGSSD